MLRIEMKSLFAFLVLFLAFFGVFFVISWVSAKNLKLRCGLLDLVQAIVNDLRGRGATGNR